MTCRIYDRFRRRQEGADVTIIFDWTAERERWGVTGVVDAATTIEALQPV